MKKGEFVIAVLTQLASDWKTAEWLKILVQQGEITDQVIQSLFQTLTSSVSSSHDQPTAKKIQKSAALLQQIYKKSEQWIERNEQSLEKELSII